MATEGDFGQATLQEVATTLAEALRANSRWRAKMAEPAGALR